MASTNKIAIKVDQVSKTFKLPHEKHASIKSALVNFKKSAKGYEEQKVLNDISFEIENGDFFGIVGRNGSGKSTLLKLMAGIYTPNSGSITVNGKLTPFIELGVGFNPELTGRENVYLNGALLGFSRKEMQAMYQDIVTFAELEKFMDQKLKNYSSGMQVRLAFSIAIRAESDILLIDEVLAVGDQSFQEKCYEYFTKLRHSHKTVILVTHDMESVRRFCNKVLMLDKSNVRNGVMTVEEAVLEYNRVNHLPSAQTEKTRSKNKTDISIKSVKLFNGANQETSSFVQGEALTLEIGVNRSGSAAKTSPLVVGIAFHDRDGVNLAGPNSMLETITAGVKTVRYTIPKLPFNMGDYKVTIALLDEKATIQYDLSLNEVSFFVNTPDVQHGKFILEGRWQYDK